MGRKLLFPNNKSLTLVLGLLYLVLQLLLYRSFGANNDLGAFKIGYGFPSSSNTLVGKEMPEADVLIDLDQEIQKGLDYARSIQDTKRKLVFVHIPKTAGTTVEEVGGLQAQLAWGSCLFNHRPKRRGNVCHYPSGQFEWPMKIG